MLVVFVLSNRVPVALGLWPFGTANVWLGPVMLGALGLGFVLGLLAHLPRHFSLHRRARNAEKRLAQLSGPEGSGKTGP
ncbi:lipopolysaccharide assembly protein LapA domain-containing protein [Acidocella sp.]|uniref:lipopolysaccharide assembly protein LapA domain-containing protein n=1 Tax=Acidocella sp. TaxID=50710 RepID=UPI0026080B2C|nr:lipopolysaccharide assembly protein LapA domain-containing protein [Acidocella sp.]